MNEIYIDIPDEIYSLYEKCLELSNNYIYDIDFDDSERKFYAKLYWDNVFKLIEHHGYDTSQYNLAYSPKSRTIHLISKD